MFVSVAVPIPAPGSFTYAVPEPLRPRIAVGKRVVVPFGRRRLTGWITGLPSAAPAAHAIREVCELPDDEALFDAGQLAFYEWISRYYLHPLGKVIAEALPGGIDGRSERWLRVAEPPAAERTSLAAGARQILECLAACPDGVAIGDLRRMIGRDDLARDLRLLAEAGHLVCEWRTSRPPLRPRRERWIGPAAGLAEGFHGTKKQQELLRLLREGGERPLASLERRLREAAFLRPLEAGGAIRLFDREPLPGGAPSPRPGGGYGELPLNGAQADALAAIREALAACRFSPFLLHGVTGSGKTEVYLRAAADVLQGGGGVLYLVPEIALTTQLLARVRDRFPGREIAVVHSGIAPAARYDQWRRIRSGAIRLVLGARSALFAPLRELRLIVVDEEHDPSYKQDDRLRYNARDLALVLGRLAGAAVVLGSATPWIQTHLRAQQGDYRRLTLPSRIDHRPLPAVEVVDMRTQRDAEGRTPLLSAPLVAALAETLADRKQALLFLNRRGFHTFLYCPDCGHSFRCPACDLSLTHHADRASLVCHHCDYATRPPESCPACHAARIRSQGAGTERIEEEVRRLFPLARVCRMDSDTTARKGETERLLGAVARLEVDVLVGTQMITKGHDFPEITLVGVIAADGSLNLPDFRAAERTFQLLTQVSGRGGRGEQPGRVVIQTFNPGHYAIRRAQAHDYEGFFDEELPLRRELGYPPFSRLIALHFSHLQKGEGKKAVDEIGRRARELAATGAGADVLGPAESPLPRLRGRYRWQMLLRGSQSGPLRQLVERLLEGAGRSGLEIRVDVDPVHFM